MRSELRDFLRVIQSLREQFYCAVEDDALARFSGKRVQHIKRRRLHGVVVQAQYEETYGSDVLSLTYKDDETGKLTTTNIMLLELVPEECGTENESSRLRRSL